MFTGIVQSTALVSWVKSTPGLTRYALTFPMAALSGLTPGASVSVHGVCQTVTHISGQEVQFDAIAQTCERTTLGSVIPGQILHIERAAKIGDEIGGHLLSGHIMERAKLVHREDFAETCILRIQCSPHLMKYLLQKGFVALNGVSLTVVNPDKKQPTFEVHLIPETLRITTFRKLQVGNEVNLEIDSQTQAIVETVERVLADR